MPRTAAAVLLSIALAAPCLADGPSEPSYADKPASWWIDRLLRSEDPETARQVLRKMGNDASPFLAARLATTLESADRSTLLGLIATGGSPPASVAPHLRRCLAAASWEEQRAALEVARLLGPAASVLADDIAGLLAAPRREVRDAACRALAECGDAAVPHVPALAALLADDAPSFVATAAVARLGVRAQAAVPALAEMAAVGPPRATVVRALAAAGPDDPRTAAEVVRAARSDIDAAREAARELVTRTLPPGGALLTAAAALATDPDRENRVAAATGLGRIADARGAVAEESLTLLEDEDGAVIGAAAAALVRLAERDHSFVARVAAAWTKSPFPRGFIPLLAALRPESGPALLDAAASPRDDLRDAAWHVLQRSPDGTIAAGAPRLIELLTDERVPIERRRSFLALLTAQRILDDGVRADVMAAIVCTGAPELAVGATWLLGNDASRRDALVAAAARPEVDVRAAALHAMHRLAESHDDIRTAAVRALGDSDRTVRVAALSTLQGAGAEAWRADSPSRRALLSRLEALVGGDHEQRSAALGLFQSLPPEAFSAGALVAALRFEDSVEMASTLLERCGEDPSPLLLPQVRGSDAVAAARAARVLLARGESPEAAAHLIEWLDSKDPRVARAAAIAACGLPRDAIVRIGGALVRAARAGVAGVAYPACFALGKIAADEPAARDALLAVADDPSNSAYAAMSQHLVALGEPGRQRMVAHLDSKVRDARRNAAVQIQGAARNGASALWDAAVPALERMAAGDDLELARIAADALAAIRR